MWRYKGLSELEIFCFFKPIKENEVIEMFNKIENNYGKLDVLFNNAGGAQNCGTLDECKLENFQDTMNLNVTGSWLTMK